jgi:hypothetical protein
METRGPKIESWVIACFIVPQLEWVLWAEFDDFISVFVFYLLGKI